MAQIVTITNPLTGQPAQVDQLEHTAQQIDDAVTRAIGYGLGGKYGFDITGSTGDANNAKYNGWYTTNSNTANLPTKLPHIACKEGTILTAVRSAQVKQTFFDNNYGYIATRLGNANTSVWGEWEWVNSPMYLGVEYRTTERYLGKPVYTKLVDCGAGPNATRKTVSAGISNVDRAVSANGSWGALSIPYEWFSGDSSSAQAITVTLNGGNIEIASTVDYSTRTIYALVKYTKTTD